MKPMENVALEFTHVAAGEPTPYSPEHRDLLRINVVRGADSAVFILTDGSRMTVPLEKLACLLDVLVEVGVDPEPSRG